MSSTWNNIYSYQSEISTLEPVSCGGLGGYTIFCALTRTTDRFTEFRVSDTRLNTLYTEWIISEFVSHWSRSWLPRKTRVWNFDLHFSLSTANKQDVTHQPRHRSEYSPYFQHAVLQICCRRNLKILPIIFLNRGLKLKGGDRYRFECRYVT